MPPAQPGPRFDVRELHDHILDGGALPLDALDSRIKAWVGEKKNKLAP